MEPDETTLETAARELAEETGIQKVKLSFSALADFLLTAPERRETLAVYRCRLTAVPVLVPNDEILDFRWWSPSDRLSDDMSPLDAEIGRRVYRQLTSP